MKCNCQLLFIILLFFQFKTYTCQVQYQGVYDSMCLPIYPITRMFDFFQISLKQSTSSFQILLARLYDFVAIPFETEGDVRDVSDSIQLNKDTAKKMESAFIDLLRINAEKTDITSISQVRCQFIIYLIGTYCKISNKSPA